MNNKAKKNDSIVISKLPDAGLGNKLFTWAHGLVFSTKNNLPHLSNGFTKIKIGPIIRREKSLRFYANYFSSSKIISKIGLYLLLKKKKNITIDYLDCDKLIDTNEDCVYIFNQIPNWSDYFKNIRENRTIVKEQFFICLNNNVSQKYIAKKSPVIGVHIRMGDFKKMAATTDFAKVGHTRTPMQYFIDCINLLRNASNKNLSVTIFSDGKKSELEEILALENTSLAEDDLDILQMLHLSKSKVIILSAGSTFGQWAAYLSDAAIINHYQHFSSYIRPKEVNDQSFEGIIDFEKPLPNQLITYCQNL